MAEIPHLKFPFKFTNAGPAEVIEQDSDEEVIQNVLVIASCPRGFRIELPEFGVIDQTFASPVQGDIFRAQIEPWEPRIKIIPEVEIADIITRVTLNAEISNE